MARGDEAEPSGGRCVRGPADAPSRVSDELRVRYDKQYSRRVRFFESSWRMWVLDKAFRVEARGIKVGQQSGKHPTKGMPNRDVSASKLEVMSQKETSNV